MQTVFVTGSDRGIGLEFVRQYAQEGWRVLASYLGPDAPSPLKDIAESHTNIVLIQLDVTDFTRLKMLVKELITENIDVLINNAGILCSHPFGELDPLALEQVYLTNAIAPLMICEAFHPLMNNANSVIVSISSKTASIGGDATEDMIAYRMSKAALNMAMREVSRKLAPKGVQVLLLAPGYVKTGMSPQGTLEPSQSVKMLRQVIAKRSELMTGGFYDRYGMPIEW